MVPGARRPSPAEFSAPTILKNQEGDSGDARSLLNCSTLQAQAPRVSGCGFPEAGEYRCIFLRLPVVAINNPIFLKNEWTQAHA
jgi:hypothetical protein